MCLVDGQTIAMSNKYLVPANVTVRSARRSSFPIGGSLAIGRFIDSHLFKVVLSVVGGHQASGVC